MEGPLLVLKSWMLTALAIWVYRRWFQRVAPRSPRFESFCADRPVVGAIWGAHGHEQRLADALALRLGRGSAAVATLGGYPWPHYRLELRLSIRPGAVFLHVIDAKVLRSREGAMPALASLLRDALNELPEGAQAWLHEGAFNNGVAERPAGGWSVQRGTEARPRLAALEQLPERVQGASLGLREPDAALLASGHGVDDAVPRVAG